MEVNEAKRLKDLERENGELKKMLAESLLEIRVLKFVFEKKL
jgi:putative transposase